MARVLIVLPGTADAGPAPGYWVAEVDKLRYEFTAAGARIGIGTVGSTPAAGEAGTPVAGEDQDFVRAVAREFTDDPDGALLTLDQLSDPNLMSARRAHQALVRSGLAYHEAWSAVADGVYRALRNGGDFVGNLVESRPLSDALRKQILDLPRQCRSANAQAGRDALARVVEIPEMGAPVDIANLSNDELLGYQAVVFPGGRAWHAKAAANVGLGRLLACCHRAGRAIATLGRGACVLLAAGGRPNGQWIFEGYRLAAVLDEEERQATDPGEPSWSVAGALKCAGAIFDEGPMPWLPHVVVDRHLITGQNSASATPLAHALLNRLGLRPARPAHRVERSPQVHGAVDECDPLTLRFFESLSAGDVDGAISLCVPDAPVNFLPLGVSGTAAREGRALLQEIVTALAGPRIGVRCSFTGVDGCRVIELRLSGTQRADLFGLANQARRFDLDQCWLMWTENGKIREVRAFWCQAQLYRRLSVRRLDQPSVLGQPAGGKTS